MSAIANDRPRPRAATRRPAPPEPDRVNWHLVAFGMGIAAQLAGAIWFAAQVDRRVTAIEEQLPPGIVQRLDERTTEIQAAIARIERRPS